MSDWRPLMGEDEKDFEILVGLYDKWLRQIRYGPTPGECVLHHTPMMDLAHERRFAVGEAQLDISNFEHEHCSRISYAIDLVERRIRMEETASQSQTMLDTSTQPEISLAGAQFEGILTSECHQVASTRIWEERKVFAEPSIIGQKPHGIVSKQNEPMNDQLFVEIEDSKDALSEEEAKSLVARALLSQTNAQHAPRQFKAKRFRKEATHGKKQHKAPTALQDPHQTLIDE